MGEIVTRRDERAAASIGERYDIRGRLGMGGMGVVYEALDRQRGMLVALKSLRQLDATALYRFKKEFRALCDISHPNLVELHDLFGDGDDWFFTMELVVGTTFLKHVRPDGFVKLRPQHVRDTVPPRGRETDPLPLAGNPGDETGDMQRAAPRAQPEAHGIAYDEVRLRESMRQLAEGVCALHGAGKLHRDLKPSNVLVAEDGRVVICDFGLVRSVNAVDDHTSDDRLTGTPAYMSPEQACNEPLTEASDWYSVGVMLYEALTGRRPHVTSSLDALRARRTVPVLAPHYLVDDVPEDLEQLCLDLLKPRPEDRPTGSEILARLGGEDSPSSVSTAVQAIPFIGRERELLELQRAASRVTTGTPGIAFVTGSSGLGKSALVRCFLEAAHDDHTIVLQGRCYERESVPYKALDSLVDALSTTLMGMRTEWLEAHLPTDITALAKLFPVLKRVDLVAAPARRTLGSPDPQETRRRAFRAMRQLLAALARDKRLVLYLDDVQWGDADSAALIAEILRPPQSPPLMLVLAHRDGDDAAASSFLRVFGAEIARPGFACDVTRVSVGPLTVEDSQALASALLASRRQAPPDVVASIAGEARGNPFFVQELVHHAARAKVGSRLVLDDVLAERLAQLPGDALTLLRVLGVAGKPIDFVVAATAAGLDTTATSALAALRTQRLVRIRGGQQMLVETYHDRVREVVVSRMPADELRSVHGAMARALELHGRNDPELLLEYRRGAGHLDEALRHACTAARNASDALAFDRAAALYRVALDLHRATSTGAEGARDEERRLETQLGDALANAGRGGDAATAYLAAAKGASMSDALELERRAAEQLMFSGRIAEGVDIIRRVLAAVDLKLPETPRGALLSFLLRRMKLRLRGLDHEARDASELSPVELRRIDLCWSIAIGLGLNDNIRGTDFQTRHLLLALASGEPYRISRALATETGYAAAGGKLQKAEKMAELAFELARRVDNPHALGLAKGSYGLAAFLTGRFRESVTLNAEAEQVFRDRCSNVTWEKNTVVLFGLTALFQLGEIGELCARLPRLLREAEDRGNYFADVMLRVSRTNVAWLVTDEPDEAERNIVEAIGRWPKDRFVLPHYYELVSRTGIDLYRGDPERALARIEERLPMYRASFLDRVQRVRIETRIAHCGAANAVAALKPPKQRGRLLARAEKLARSVLSENATWAHGLARMALGRIAELRGITRLACEELEAAVEAFDAHEMAMYANVARRQRGEIIGGDEGRLAVTRSDERMALHGIKRPDRFAYFLSPGREASR